MKISVVHHSLDLPGGGDRVCLSLLEALDRTRHEADLRCVVPPAGVRFAGDVQCGGGEEPPPLAAFRRVRLVRVPRAAGGPEKGSARGFDAEIRDLFRGTGSDVVVVTDGGFIMAKTDAPRVVWYCNSALRDETEALSLRRPRHPRNMVRLWRYQLPFKRRIALARDKKVVIVPNSEDTRAEVSAAIGRPVAGRVVYPPVDTQRFFALAKKNAKETRTVTVARFAPEKNLGEAVRIMRAVGGRYDIVGNVKYDHHRETLRAVRASITRQMRLHVNVGRDVLEDAVAGARAYLQTSKETFGVAVAEAVAAGCVPAVPDNSAHPETVPFRELRYRTEAEAAGIVRGSLDGRHDSLLPALRDHVRRFSVEEFQSAMLGIIEGRDC